MGTFLFDKIVFGPVKSRRLGISLGINLLPADSKVCNFNCIYCECGWTPRRRQKKAGLPAREEVARKLEHRLEAMAENGELPDVITFAGNGEPTLHPDFPGIVDDTVMQRNRFAPGCRIAVLSNSTMIGREEVFQSLLKVDDNILKLDSAVPETVRKLDCPLGNFSPDAVIAQLARFGRHARIQTLFVRGEHGGEIIDNTTPEELDAWIRALKRIRPGMVMIYTISRSTPAKNLQRVHPDELTRIANLVKQSGLETEIQIS